MSADFRQGGFKVRGSGKGRIVRVQIKKVDRTSLTLWFNDVVFKHMPQHLCDMAFPTSKEAPEPNGHPVPTIGAANAGADAVSERLQELAQLSPQRVGDDELPQILGEIGSIVHLDDWFDPPAQIAGEQLPNGVFSTDHFRSLRRGSYSHL
jgi:hypothetical protein